MGAVNFSIDLNLVKALSSVLPFDIFVETGTFEGDTVDLVRGLFREVYSIELSEKYVENARHRFKIFPNINILQGNSPSVLRELIPKLRQQSVLFFLDAHWCVAEHTAGQASQCPLIEELNEIGYLNQDSVIIIDDARLFQCTPPFPHDVTQWPIFADVLGALRSLSQTHRLTIVNDYFVYFPVVISPVVERYAREFGIDWLHVIQEREQLASEREEVSQIRQDFGRVYKLIVGPVEYAKGYDDRSWTAIIQEIEKALLVKEQELIQNRFRAAHTQEIEKTVLAKEQELIQKDKVIQELSFAVNAYRICHPYLKPFSHTFRFAHGLTQLFIPRIGRLAHHPPTPLRPPAPYVSKYPLDTLPRISVVTPSFMQGQFIERAIKSVLSQDYPNLEYFVEDGGSDDGTSEIIIRYADRLAGYRCGVDKGQANAINMGFAKSGGEIMCWLNSDDMLLPGALAYVGEYFVQHPEVDVVYGNRILIDVDDREIGRWVLPPHNNQVLSYADFVPQETLFWRRSLWNRVGACLDESFRFAMDWDLLLRFRESGSRMVRLRRFLGAFRIHDSQKTSAEIEETGFQEMQILRCRALGIDEVDQGVVHRAVAPYLIRHVLHDLAFRVEHRLGLLRTNGPR